MGDKSVFRWSTAACAVLAVNDLIEAREDSTRHHLAAIVWVAISIWNMETFDLSSDEQKIGWNKTVGLLMAGHSPLLPRTCNEFNKEIRQVLSDAAAIEFDEEIERDGGPTQGNIMFGFEAIRGYTVRPLRIDLLFQD